MVRDTILDVLIAIVVIGSVFGADHISRLWRWLRQRRRHNAAVAKQAH